MNHTASNETINICGVLLHARPDRLDDVKASIQEFTGLEIHEITEDGRFIITLDLPDRYQMGDTISDLNKVEGVLSAAMIYQHTE